MIIKARFPSTCARCQGQINVDDRIDWTKGRPRDTKHEVCPPRATPVAVDREQRRSVAPQAAPQAPPTIDVTGIVAFLNAARERGLKWPKARFLSPEQTEMRLSVASETARQPGSLQVVIEGRWIGNVLPSGVCYGNLASYPKLVDTLKAIQEDPVGAARAYGALMCRCSFCNLALTDAGSVEVGYGPICAANWGLPWERLGVPTLTEIPTVPEVLKTELQ